MMEKQITKRNYLNRGSDCELVDYLNPKSSPS